MAIGRIRIDIICEGQGKSVVTAAGFSMDFNGYLPPAYEIKDGLEKVIVAYIREYEENKKWPQFEGFEGDEEE